MAMIGKISLLISDDNRLFREGIRRILNSRRMEVVGEVKSLAEAAEELHSADTPVDLLLCDPSVDLQEEFSVMKEITQDFPNLKIVLLTNGITQARLDIAVEAGASGFLPKDISADALRYSLELVVLGEQIFPTVQSLLEAKPPAPVAAREVTLDLPRHIPLSARESQILNCLVNGLPNKTIARNLNMAEATVKVHLKALLRKINARNRTQAAIWGMNHAYRDVQEPRIYENPEAARLTPVSVAS
jgi:two-component system nitrate/nitrite response regulator NarL